MRIWPVVLVLACSNRAAAPRDESGSARVPEPKPAVAVTADAPEAAVSMDAAPPVELPAIAVEVPTKAAALQTWLVAAHYKAWAKESKSHASDGPHGDAVKTFVSPSLLASLQKQGAAHPVGAAAVKELYTKGAHTGWAVSVKVAAESKEGQGWYWYEVFSTAAGAKPGYEGLGKKLCRDCHSEGGTDQVLIPFPLQ